MWLALVVLIIGVMFGGSFALTSHHVFTFAWFAMGYFIAGAVLYIWRSCDACGFHLYQFLDTRWWPADVTRSNQEPRMPHASAERLLNSFSYGIIWSKARQGVAHCAWCGHADRDRTYE